MLTSGWIEASLYGFVAVPANERSLDLRLVAFAVEERSFDPRDLGLVSSDRSFDPRVPMLTSGWIEVSLYGFVAVLRTSEGSIYGS
jgi:hypothetical protein